MLTKQEFDAVASGDYDAYRRVARRRELRSLFFTILGGAVICAAILYPAWRETQRFASLDLERSFDAFGVRR
jgi:hypothetical protein